ncbi:hypothetical protein ACFWVT_05755 [Streptomyces cyaneofuscatus]|uniref:hypothetical protein n=1 Tax=Streptomyces cyaneofuscatus TaxID=66883 RepID=UPI0036517D4D
MNAVLLIARTTHPVVVTPETPHCNVVVPPTLGMLPWGVTCTVGMDAKATGKTTDTSTHVPAVPLVQVMGTEPRW